MGSLVSPCLGHHPFNTVNIEDFQLQMSRTLEESRRMSLTQMHSPCQPSVCLMA